MLTCQPDPLLLPHRQLYELSLDRQVTIYDIVRAQALLQVYVLSDNIPPMHTFTWQELQEGGVGRDADQAYAQALPDQALQVPGIAIQRATRRGIETFVIDGNHRAARCLALRRPFSVYVLSPEEATLTQRVIPQVGHPSSCAWCERAQDMDTQRTLAVDGVMYTWSVDLAEMLLQLCRQRGYLTQLSRRPSELARIRWDTLVDQRHCTHLPDSMATIPGIGVTVLTAHGPDVLLIDGYHRAAHALHQGRTFLANVLPYPASMAAILATNNRLHYGSGWSGAVPPQRVN